MKYHILTHTVTTQDFEKFMEVWQLDAKRLDTIGDHREVWEITCNDPYDYDAMQDAEEAWGQYGNSWEQLETPWEVA